MGRASSPPASSNSTKIPINLLRGWPATSLLPAQLISKAASDVLSRPEIYYDGLEYGPDPGDTRARKVIASWLHAFYQPEGAADFERICMTGGASQSLGVMLGTLTDTLYTRAAWMSSPCYFQAFKIFRDAGFATADGRLRGVPEDDGGTDVAWLKEALVKCDLEWERQPRPTKPSFKPGYPKLYRHVIYVVPSFSNPSSRTMSLERREQLVRIAREHDALVVCDDVYDMLHWRTDGSTVASHQAQDRADLPRVVDIDRRLDGGVERPDADGYGNVVSNGSFSKLSGPGVRCGWIEAGAKLAYVVSQSGVQKSGGAPSQLTSTYMAELLESGALGRHITETLQPAYATRFCVLRNAIKTHLEPLGARLTQADREISGGYFLWIHLPPLVAGAEVARRALSEENVVVARGEMFEVPEQSGESVPGITFPNDIRLCFAWMDEAALEEGTRRVAAVIRRIQDGIQEDTSNQGQVKFDQYA